MVKWFYDKDGSAVVFQHEDMLLSKTGKRLCWIYRGSIYGLRTGKHIGWFEDDKVFDSDNRVLLFDRYASGLPYKPAIGSIPGTPGIPGKPGKPGFGGIPGRPGRCGFSHYDSIDYFIDNQ